MILYFSWPLIDEAILNSKFSEPYASIKEKIESIYVALDESDVTEKITDVGNKLITAIDGEKPPTSDKEKQDTITTNDDFSINGIALGMDKSLVEFSNGFPKTSFINEYGSKWFVYHQNYQDFVMVSYDSNDLVNAIYTNQPSVTSSYAITENTSMEDIRSILPNKQKAIIKQNVYLEIEEQFDLFDLDSYDITFFYDEKQNNEISAIFLIDDQLEKQKETLYGVASEELQIAYEQQMFEVINATRAKFNIPTLINNAPLAVTAFKHSEDMATNDFFSHDNLKGESPFDRMEADQLRFTVAGENLASGQFNSIFAHEALMNSQGHRDNILHKDFEQIGIGVDFNESNVPYFTMKFFTP